MWAFQCLKLKTTAMIKLIDPSVVGSTTSRLIFCPVLSPLFPLLLGGLSVPRGLLAVPLVVSAVVVPVALPVEDLFEVCNVECSEEEELGDDVNEQCKSAAEEAVASIARVQTILN